MRAGAIESELLALVTICAGKPASGVLLNNLTVQSFHYPGTQLMYRRLMARLRSEGHVPSWVDLLNDPTIPEERRLHAQRRVNIKKLKPLVSKQKGEALSRSLDDYRKLRATYELLNTVGNTLKQPTADVGQLIKKLKSGAIAIDSDHKGVPATIDGVNGSHVVTALTSPDAFIKTGFEAFDIESGGITEGAVFLIAADTGGYKSATALQLCMNIARNGRRVGFYSLEMPQNAVVRRQISNICELDARAQMRDYVKERDQAKSRGAKAVAEVDAKQAERAKEIAVTYEQRTKDWAAFFHVTCPADEVDISWILQQAELSDREIILIDYLGLLAGLSGDDQWRAMSNAARQCKIWTNRTGKTVILLAQMRFADGKPELKYSKAVLDHCDGALGLGNLFVNGRNYLCVHQMKAREGRKFPFMLRVFPEFNKIVDLRDETDLQIASMALEDMRSGKDPAKRYEKDPGKQSKSAGIDDDQDDYEEKPKLTNGGFSGAKSYDLSGDGVKDTRSKMRDIARTMTDEHLKQKTAQTARVKALHKLYNNNVTSLSLDEAAIQAEEVIKRWEDASAGKRIKIDQIAKELLGLSRTKTLCKQVKRLQGDTAARRRLSTEELAIFKAQVEAIKHATKVIKTKGSDYLSEQDFYAVDDLTLAVQRGEEPIADPNTLDHAWERNAVAWADQPAITLPNSAKPKDKRWGIRPESEDAIKDMQRRIKSQQNNSQRDLRAQHIKLWPPKGGKLKDFHYLDDVQLDTVVNIATKYAIQDARDIPIDTMVDDIGHYLELLGPGRVRVASKKRKPIVFNDKNFSKACKKLGLSAA